MFILGMHPCIYEKAVIKPLIKTLLAFLFSGFGNLSINMWRNLIFLYKWRPSNFNSKPQNIDPVPRNKSKTHSSMTILINSYDKFHKEIIIINCQSCNCKLIRDQSYINELCNFSLHSSVLETFA